MLPRRNTCRASPVAKMPRARIRPAVGNYDAGPSFWERFVPDIFRMLSGCTVSRRATIVEPSNVSIRWLQVRHRNSPLLPRSDVNSIRR